MRTAYLLTTNVDSDRTIFSKKLLERTGFDVVTITCIPHKNKVLSNKLSMLYIYSLIKDNQNEYSYVFENDINIIESINLNEIIEYEKISEMFFYLGLCEPRGIVKNTGIKINGHDVFSKTGNVRGLHAIGLSKKGADELIKFSKESTHTYMDMILEDFSKLFPANVVRYDLKSYISGHKGVFYQDRKRFASEISK